MNLSKETLAILKNFASINSNLTIQPGNTLTTVSSGKNILAQATVVETFPTDFGIYDVSEFLGALSLFDSPELEFTDQYVTIQNDRKVLKYWAAAPDLLTSVPSIKSFPNADVEFDLPGSIMAQVQKASAILGVTDFAVLGDGSDIKVQVGDKANSTSNIFTVTLGETDKSFRANFKVDNLKMMAGDYQVTIGGKKISRFVSTTQDLTYYVAIELDSTFDF